MKILVVDHEKVNRANLADKLIAHGHQATSVGDGQEALDRLHDEPFDLVFVDAKTPKIDGVELLRRIKQGPRTETPVILMSSNGSIPVAVQAVKLGAYDFIKKPIPTEKLRTLLTDIDRHRGNTTPTRPRTAAESRGDIDREIIGVSPAIERVKRMIRIASQADANVLIHGETGVGKDLVASVIHRQSHRCKAPYVKVGCTLLPPSLIESELYGHEEGSFTGADQYRPGRFELADGGTIYLDDVDDISLDQQAKLLRVIEEKVFERVGGNRVIKANVRVVASTKFNLLDRVANGTFRQDLYYRLDVLRLRIPPLRARLEDIPALGRPSAAADRERELPTDSSRRPGSAGAAPMARQCARALPHAGACLAGRRRTDLGRNAALTTWKRTTPSTIRRPLSDAGLAELSRGNEGGSFRAAIDFAEKQLLVDALRSSNGNKTAAAVALGMKASTFRDKLAKHGLL